MTAKDLQIQSKIRNQAKEEVGRRNRVRTEYQKLTVNKKIYSWTMLEEAPKH